MSGASVAALGSKKYDQVDVAGIIQLAAPILPWASTIRPLLSSGNRHSAATAGRALLPDATHNAMPIESRRPPDRSAPRSAASPARPHNVAQRDQQGCFRFHAAEQAPSRRLRSMQRRRRGRCFRSSRQMRLRLTFEQPDPARAIGGEQDQTNRERLPPMPRRMVLTRGSGRSDSRPHRLLRCEIGQPVRQSCSPCPARTHAVRPRSARPDIGPRRPSRMRSCHLLWHIGRLRRKLSPPTGAGMPASR